MFSSTTRRALLGLALVAGCGGDDEPTTTADDIAQTDTADDTAEDTVSASDADPDAASDTSAASDTRSGTATDFGIITGACGTLSDALAAATPSFHVSVWHFDDPVFDPNDLDPGPKQRFDSPNAGGSSVCTEVMSIQYLLECEDAVLYKTETEIVYDEVGDLTDYAVTIDGETIGVSVTRAYLGPTVSDYSVEAAAELLAKKFASINESSANVSAADAWTKQILHVWTLHEDWVDELQDAWAAAPAADKADTVVLVTVEQGSDTIVTDACDN